MLVVLLHAPCHAQSTIRLARIADVPDQFVGGEILRAVYGRLRIAVEFIDAAGARALALSSSGAVDGEVHRIASVGRDYPSLIQLTPAINYIEPAAFTTSLDFEVHGWDSIKDYNIGIVRGVGSSEIGTQGMASVQKVTDLDTLVRMLDAGRFDVAVTDLFSGQVEIGKMKLAGRIHALMPPLARIYIYHYLHQKHRDLATRVETVIREMDASGELSRLRETLTRQLLTNAAGGPS
jgi:ABC-type amino acid transport substrate-binding protein